MGRIFATADIGSNTAHLLIAETLPDGRIRRLVNESEWLSLGENVARDGRIPEAKILQLAGLLRNYEALARERQAETLYVFATEAMRAAENGREALDLIEEHTNLSVSLISPQLEAELSLEGARTDAPGPISLFVEIGGGSAQVALCDEEGSIAREYSLPIGTGRLIAQANLEYPAKKSTRDQLLEAVDMALGRLPRESLAPGIAVASGGVGRGLLRALHRDGDQWLELPEIEFLAWSVARLTVDQIVARFGVKPKRAAALLPGAVAYGEILRRFGRDRIFVSEFGVREGAIRQMAQGKLQAWLA